MAVEKNATAAGDGVDVLYGGVGKINTAIATTTVILAARPVLVVNYGTCGKITPNLRGLLEISEVVQRDMVAMPLAPRGVTPLCDGNRMLTSGHGNAICGTGGSCVTATDPWLTENKIDVVDMELFAIAHVCKRFGVPWRAFKFITDDADDLAHDHWTANVAGGGDLFWKVMHGEVIQRTRGTLPSSSMS
jgi:adenosylhomocysteine nucleosidase